MNMRQARIIGEMETVVTSEAARIKREARQITWDNVDRQTDADELSFVQSVAETIAALR